MFPVFASALSFSPLFGLCHPSFGFLRLGRRSGRCTHLALAFARILKSIFELVGGILFVTLVVYLFNEIVPGCHYTINEYKRFFLKQIVCEKIDLYRQVSLKRN